MTDVIDCTNVLNFFKSMTTIIYHNRVQAFGLHLYVAKSLKKFDACILAAYIVLCTRRVCNGGQEFKHTSCQYKLMLNVHNQL